MAGGKDCGSKRAHDRFYLASLARDNTQEAYNLILAVLRDEKAKMSDRIKASELILERGWGKAPIEINLGTQEDGVKFIFEVREFNALQSPAVPLTLDAVNGAVHHDDQHELATTPARGQS